MRLKVLHLLNANSNAMNNKLIPLHFFSLFVFPFVMLCVFPVSGTGIVRLTYTLWTCTAISLAIFSVHGDVNARTLWSTVAGEAGKGATGR